MRRRQSVCTPTGVRMLADGGYCAGQLRLAV